MFNNFEMKVIGLHFPSIHFVDNTLPIADGDQREIDHNTKVTTNKSKRISEMFHNCILNK